MTDPSNLKGLAALREPFPESEIRYLPRVWCRTCRDSRSGCKSHQLIQCRKCGNRISSAHIDLKFVGHAEATNRLLNVDPAWSWEPVAVNDKGLPQYDENGGLWIRLTVCGVTRLGYGNAEGKRGGDAVKEIIGDAIRNAGMRFGMALDLWTSSELEIADNGPEDEQQPSVPERHLRQVRPGETDPWIMPQPPGEPPEQKIANTAADCTDHACIRDLYREAKAAGFLDATVKIGDETGELGAYLIARGKELAAPAPKTAVPEVTNVGLPQDGHEAAVAALRAWAAEQHIADIDADAHAALGAPLDAVSAEAIWGLLNQLTAA